MSFYHWLPGFFQWLLKFAFEIILVRGLIGNEILQELRQRGVFKEGIIHSMLKHADKWYLLARKAAIVEHFRLQARGETHKNSSPFHCGEGRCGILS